MSAARYTETDAAGEAVVRWSIEVRDADTGEVLARRDPGAVMATASVGKLFLMAEAARRFEDGTLDPDAVVRPRPGEVIADSGLLYLMRGQDQRLGDLCLLMGAVSDNSATNIMLRVCGLEQVAELTRDLGFHRSGLFRPVVMDPLPGQPPLSTGTGEELNRFMRRLHADDIVSPAVSAMVRHWLAADCDLSMTASAFRLDPLAHGEVDRGILLVNKTGTNSTVRADVGLVQGPVRTVAYAVLANWDPEEHDSRDQVLTTMARLGERIRTWVTAAPSSTGGEDVDLH